MPTDALLDLQLAAARARDAVYSPFERHTLVKTLSPLACISVDSQAADRETYLRRPDLGRRLAKESATRLANYAGEGYDIAFVVADGLSPASVTNNAAPIILECVNQLQDLRISPIILAGQARVALGDEIAQILHAKIVVILLGERPGLSAADSLGFYLTWAPYVGIPDSRRNCISNIHADGLSAQIAVRTAVWLMREARHLKISGVALKEDAGGNGSISQASPPGMA
jgi:ethanolamine ammonia-lyase small subunit